MNSSLKMKRWTSVDIPKGSLVSIIVAVYNVEQYLPFCVDSLRAQKHNEIEIVLVDDGSTDRSGAICDAYCLTDARIRVLHQSNTGLSAARNAGTKIANGDWIVYVDGDDIVDANYVLKMIEAARKYSAAIVSCKFKLFYDDDLRSESFAEKSAFLFDGVDASAEILSEKRGSTSAWGKLAVASLWKSVEFPTGRKFEDLPVTWKVFAQSEKAVLLQDELYYYRKRKKSISDTDSATPSSVLDYATSILQMLDETRKSEYADKLKEASSFRACLECCRLYEMCLQNDVTDESIVLIMEFASKCLKIYSLDALRNRRAPVLQRTRILAMAIAPKLAKNMLFNMKMLLFKSKSIICKDRATCASFSDFIKHKNILCMADTPFQLMSLMCIFSDPDNKSFERCDLIIDPRFSKAHEVANRLRETRLFSGIYCSDKCYPEHDNKTTRAILLDCVKLEKDVPVRLYGSYPEIKGRQYDVLLTSYPTLKAFDSKRCAVRGGETVFFDDGSGSHNGNVFKSFCIMDNVGEESLALDVKECSFKQLIKRVVRPFLGNVFKMGVRRILLFSPTEDDRSRYSNLFVEEIKINSRLDDLKKVLASGEDSSDSFNLPQMIFLTLPGGIDKMLLEQEKELVRCLSTRYPKSLCIKLHPRRSSVDYENLEVDFLPEDDLWEALILSGKIDEETILIGYGSTAQITPHQLCGIEPTVVYLNRILKKTQPEYYAVEKSKQLLLKSYSNKERIFTPQTIDDLFNFLDFLRR